MDLLSFSLLFFLDISVISFACCDERAIQTRIKHPKTKFFPIFNGRKKQPLDSRKIVSEIFHFPKKKQSSQNFRNYLSLTHF